MANTAGLCVSFKKELMQGFHNLGGNGTANSIKCALYLQSGSLSPTATTAYSSTSEIQTASGTSGYTAGGVAVTNATAPTLSGSTAYWTPSATITFPALTCSTNFDTALLYNATNSNRAIGILTFPAQMISAAAFNIQMPSNTSSTALLQLT